MTAPEKNSKSKRLFFSTVFPEELQDFCVYPPKVSSDPEEENWSEYMPLFWYSLRWNIEVSYYEQKTFWSLCSYMVRSCHGIEVLVNLINISYCAMKILPYYDERFSEYSDKSVQEFRFVLSQGIHEQIFYARFVKKHRKAYKIEPYDRCPKTANLLSRISFIKL